MKDVALFRFIIPALFIILFFYKDTYSQGNKGAKEKRAKDSIAARMLSRPTMPAVADSEEFRIEKELVELALKGPRYTGSEHQNKIDEFQLTRAKNSWLNLLTLSTSYNDRSFAPKDQQTGAATYVYPKYFFGLNIPLGTLFSRTEVKAAREQIGLSKTNQEELARTLRKEVLTLYKQYKLYGDLITNQSRLIDDESGAFLQAEQKFRDNSISIDQYNTASKSYNNEITKRMQLQLQQDIYRLELEEKIGVDLDSVLKPHPQTAAQTTNK